MSKLQHLFVVNKAGGLIFVQSFGDSPLSGDAYLQLASTFHSLHAISQQVAAAAQGLTNASASAPSSGITKMETQEFTLTCLQTLTGLKFFVTSTPATPNVDKYLESCYTLYCDYVLKDPFYELDMPIKSTSNFCKYLKIMSKHF